MANQQRRTPRSSRTRATRYQPPRGVVLSDAGASPTSEVEVTRTSKDVNWSEEYKYVFSDIRHLLLVTAGLLVLLLVVGFLL